VLVLVENSTDAVTDALYDQLRADSVPALLLLVGRRASAPPAGAVDQADRYLGPLHADERPTFVRLFGALAPARRAELARAASRGADSSVPFLLALTAFQDDYVGLPDYVARGLGNARDDVRGVLGAVAIAHRYAGTAVPANAFAPSLNLPRDAPVRLRNVLSGQADGLVLEDRPGMWRTAHPLVAQEMLRQLLSPPGGPAAAMGESWRASLAQRCIDLIQMLADAYPQGLPGDERQLLERLFLARDQRGSFERSRRTNSEVLEDIPAGEGRLEVLRVLAETFSNESHYWAQYGRLLSYQSGDHPRAREALDRALELNDSDSVLWHMSGVVRRSELRGLLRAPSARQPSADPRTETALQAQVQHSVSLALFDLARAAELDDASEYPHVTAARLCVEVIEWAKTRSKASTYAEFLRRPAGQPYAALLDTAEDALDRLGEIIGDDTPSRYAEEASAELRQLYDDYAGLLEGWRNVLARPDVIKAPVRRRIVRAYRNRAGGWRAAGAAQRRQALALLDENLHDDPTDGRSVREWLRVARFTDASVDRAAELVSYWAEGDLSRDALFYQSVVYALLALDGRESALADYERASQRCRDRSQSFPRRRTAYEWLGAGEGLGRLVQHTDLHEWERSRTDGPDPALLARVTGRVASIARAQSGLIEFGPGLTAFFTPSFSGLVAGRDENRLVTAFIGFAYDGPQAWSVRPTDLER
jgi:tetratricopeptide (TPR) repeat protein